MTTIYLTNKDLLREIHASKCSYCWFKSPEFKDYDIIVHKISDIFEKSVIEEAMENRKSRLAKSKDTNKVDLLPTDLVFRVMTWEHVPSKVEEPIEDEEDLEEEIEFVDPTLKNKSHVRVNFPPFKHFVITSVENKQADCVGISHWKGDLLTGHFSKDHGSITRKLAEMFIKLSERYASRSNWRGYTYNEEMKGQALLQLSQVGLQFDESKSNNPFAYYTATVTNSFTRILNLEKRNQNIRDDLLEINGMNPSYTRQWGSDSGKQSGGYDE